MIAEHSKGRAQSAMEYLMTYGWAILIIAVVLGALFVLGVFNGSNISTSSCVAGPGFLCSNPTYNHLTANIVVTIGQETGVNWISANIVFVPQGTPNSQGIPMIAFNSMPANTYLATTSGGLQNGGEALLYLPVNSIIAPVAVGTPQTGTIWAYYTYYATASGIEQTYNGYVQMASITVKAS